MPITRRSHSEAGTIAIAIQVAARLRPGDVIALSGELGAGKTRFVRGLAAGLNGDPAQVSSPTFVLQQEYALPTDRTLIHIDAYRMDGPDELETIGWDETLEREDAFIAIEWPERIEESLPALRTIAIEIEHAGTVPPHSGWGGDERIIRITARPHHADRFASLEPETRECATCGRMCTSDDPFFPFCSGRCRLIDLGEWFDEKHRIAGS